MKKLMEDFSKKALYDILKLIVILITFLIPFSRDQIISLARYSYNLFGCYGLFLLGILAAFFSTYLYRRYNSRRPNFPTLNFDFQILSKRII